MWGLDVGTVFVETNGFLEVIAWRKMVRGYSYKSIFAENLAEDLLEETRRLVEHTMHPDNLDPKLSLTYRRLFGLITVKVGDKW